MDGSTASGPMANRNKVRRKGKPMTVVYRLAIASRTLAAIFAGYLLASVASVCLAQWLTMSRAEAVVTSMMLSFLVYLIAVLWCFACRTAWRAWLGLLGPSAILGAAYACGRWLS